MIERDQRSLPLGRRFDRRSASAVTVYLLLAIAFSSLAPSPVLADGAVGADGDGGAGGASRSIVLDVYLDAEGRALIVGYLEAEDPEDLAFLEGNELFYDGDTGELYAKSDGLTSAQGYGTRIDFEAEADWNEVHLAFYLPKDAGLLAVSYSEGLEYSVVEAEDSLKVEVLGYEVEGIVVVIDYDLAG